MAVFYHSTFVRRLITRRPLRLSAFNFYLLKMGSLGNILPMVVRVFFLSNFHDELSFEITMRVVERVYNGRKGHPSSSGFRSPTPRY